MKRKITIILAVIFVLTLFTGTVAYADNGSGIGGRIERTQDRLEFLKAAQPLIEEVAENREQIHNKVDQLKTLREQAKAHIKALKENSGALTEEQIQLIQSLTQQLKDCRAALKNTNTEMVQQRQHLREMRRNRNYDEVLAAYGNIISIQERRITQLDKMIGINQQIIAI